MDKNSDIFTEELHYKVVFEVFDEGLSEEDSLLLFSILHSHRFVLAYNVTLKDAPEVRFIYPLTMRGAGDVVAVLRNQRIEQGNYMYWYRRWLEWGSYKRLETLTDGEQDRMNYLIEKLVSHPFIASIEPDD